MSVITSELIKKTQAKECINNHKLNSEHSYLGKYFWENIV